MQAKYCLQGRSRTADGEVGEEERYAGMTMMESRVCNEGPEHGRKMIIIARCREHVFVVDVRKTPLYYVKCPITLCPITLSLATLTLTVIKIS